MLSAEQAYAKVEELSRTNEQMQAELTKIWTEVNGKGIFSQPKSPQNSDPTLDRITALEQKFGLKRESDFENPDLLRRLMPNKSADLPILIAGFGAGSAGAIGGFIAPYVKQLAGPMGISAIQAGELVAGWVIYKWFQTSNKNVSAFGGGILIRAIGEWAEKSGFTAGRFLGAAPRANGGNGTVPTSYTTGGAY